MVLEARIFVYPLAFFDADLLCLEIVTRYLGGGELLGGKAWVATFVMSSTSID